MEFTPSFQEASLHSSKPTKMAIDFVLTGSKPESDVKEIGAEPVSLSGHTTHPPPRTYDLPYCPRMKERAQNFPSETSSIPPVPRVPAVLEPVAAASWGSLPTDPCDPWESASSVASSRGGPASFWSPPPRDRTRDRMGSVSSVDSTKSDPLPQKPKRAARHKYTKEMAYFIWFHRADMGMNWPEVMDNFNAWFDRKRDVSGIESKYYRILCDHHVPPVREQRRGRPTPKDSKNDVKMMDAVSDLHYKWMDTRVCRIRQSRGRL